MPTAPKDRGGLNDLRGFKEESSVVYEQPNFGLTLARLDERGNTGLSATAW